MGLLGWQQSKSAYQRLSKPIFVWSAGWPTCPTVHSQTDHLITAAVYCGSIKPLVSGLFVMQTKGAQIFFREPRAPGHPLFRPLTFPSWPIQDSHIHVTHVPKVCNKGPLSAPEERLFLVIYIKSNHHLIMLIHVPGYLVLYYIPYSDIFQKVTVVDQWYIIWFKNHS